MLLRDEAYAQCKRNKGENYLATVERSMTEEEVRKIFEAQRAFGKPFATQENEEIYLGILLSQRAFDEGPGGDSPYGGNQIEKMIGRCTFEPAELRAAKASYSFEYFNLLQKVNHLRIVKGGEQRPLTQEQKRQLIDLAKKSYGATFAKVRSVLGMSEDETFNVIYYRDSIETEEKKARFDVMKAYHVIRKALDKNVKGRIAFLSIDQLDAIGDAFSKYKTDNKITDALKQAGIEDCDIEVLLNMPGFSKFGHISVCALRKIIPYLEQGMNYNDACAAAGYAFKGHDRVGKSMLLPAQTEEMESITSPVVRRAVAQTIKVINAIIREQEESPVYVNIELAREVSKSFDERAKLDKRMKENAAANERIIKRLREELGIEEPKGQDVVKLKLYEEQGGVCAYSLKQLSIEKLFSLGYAEIDHIIPYSISFDDTYNNKVLVFAEENRQKGNRLPLQYLQGERKNAFTVWTENNVRNYRKKRNLLKESVTEEDIKSFKERNLQDTKHMARFLYNYIADHLLFAPSGSGKKRRVMAVNGAVTAVMRKRWGLNKVRADGDTHHALDASVIACTTQKMINEISRHYDSEENEYIPMADGGYTMNPNTGEAFPQPWPYFREELMARLSQYPGQSLTLRKLPFYSGTDIKNIKPVFVSRMPRRKVTGAAHKDTVKGVKRIDEGFVTVKRPLSALKLNKEGEIEGYFEPSSDRLLYEALKKRLEEFGGNGETAFSEPFYKPRKDGTPGPLVKKVKLCEKTTLNVPVNAGTGSADNDTMVRIDVFYVPDDGYYWVPIYVADTKKDKLPNKAVVAFKSYSEWKEMREEDFLFSLYPNDLMRVVHKKLLNFTVNQKDSTLEKSFSVKEAFVYFVSAGISVGAITVINHDASYTIKSLGIKTLERLEKYQVDVLGNISKVKKEKRMPFS